MKRVSKFLSIAATTLAMTGTAFADDPPAGGDAAGGGDAGAGAGSGTATPAAGGDTGVTAGMYTKETWPKAGIDRPLTAAASMIEVTPLFTFSHVSIGGASANAEGAAIAARYGVSDKLEVLVAYQGIQLNPDAEFKGTLTAGIGFNAISGGAGGKLDLAPKVAFAYNLLGETAAILAGADVRYKITPKFYIGTPINQPGLSLTVKGADVMGTSVNPITFAIPVAVGFQATPELQAQVSTTVATIGIKDAGDTTTIADFTPLNLDVLYAVSNKLDVRVLLGFLDLQHAGDFIAIGAGVNVRL